MAITATRYDMYVWEGDTPVLTHSDAASVGLATLVDLDQYDIEWAVEEHGRCDGKLADHDYTIVEHGTPPPAERSKDATFAGYHSFNHAHFEVFNVPRPNMGLLTEPGWYWWACFPGCLPDGDPSGPFPTAEGAYLDAINE